MQASPRRGFTLFDLLVILAILGFLIGLLLPAIQKVREAAARAQSQNNLKQLAIAAHNYHDTFKRLPSGNDKNDVSAHVYLLPYIEQAALYQTLIGADGQPNRDTHEKGRKYVVPVLLSPLDPVTGTLKDHGTTNYLFCAGSAYPLEKNNGACYQDSKMRLVQFLDGTSNTVLIGETLLGAPVGKAPEVRRQHVALKKDALRTLKEESGVQEFKEGVNLAHDRGHSWTHGTFLQGTFTGTRRVNDEKPDVNCAGLGGLSGLRGMRDSSSVALADGSVRTVTERISLRTWNLVTNASDGEAIPNDWE